MAKTPNIEAPVDSSDEFSDLTHYSLDREAIRLLPEDFCREHEVVVLGELPPGREGVLPLGMLQVDLEGVLVLAEKHAHRHFRPVQLNTYELDQALEFGFGGAKEERGSLWVSAPRDVLPLSADQQIVFDRDQATSEMVGAALSLAIQRGASDVHIERYPNDVDLRLRIDGVLQQVSTPFSPANIRAVISYLKVLAKLDITNRRTAQDGAIRTLYSESDGTRRLVSMRLSTLPGPDGEDAVLRVLDERRMRFELPDLGMPESMLATYDRLLHHPGGMLLVTGPTASGKTTTLYASIHTINSQHNKILTVEDPIEYRIPRVNQKQISHDMGFFDYARAFMRQNPDVLMIGEIRDENTAMLGLRAAQMGHLVLATLHTRDAPSAVLRMIQLGGDRSVVLTSLLGVLSQRLARRICSECVEEYEPAPELLERLGPVGDDVVFKRGRGCEHCHDTGYQGQIGIYEMLVLNDAVRRELAASDAIDLRALDIPRLQDDAIAKVRAGITTVEEVLRVVPVEIS